MLFMVTMGQDPFFRVNVMKKDLDSLILIFHIFVQRPIMLRCQCNILETVIGFSLEATIAISTT